VAYLRQPGNPNSWGKRYRPLLPFPSPCEEEKENLKYHIGSAALRHLRTQVLPFRIGYSLSEFKEQRDIITIEKASMPYYVQ